MTPIFLWLQNSWKSQFLNHFLTTCIWGMCSAEWQLLPHLNKTSLAIMLEVGWGRASERIFGLFFHLTYFVYSTNFSTIPPSICLCSKTWTEQREILWKNKQCFFLLSPTFIERNWVVWGMFLICDINRKDKSSIKHLDTSCQDPILGRVR